MHEEEEEAQMPYERVLLLGYEGARFLRMVPGGDE
jgi:hypothetical protein